MRAVVQRVSEARVTVADEVVGKIESGILIYLGVAVNDDDADAVWMAEKAAHLRIFNDDKDLMNRSVLDEGGAALVVSQFTLMADARKGRRPSYSEAAAPEAAKRLYNRFVELLKGHGLAVQTGTFQAMMRVVSVNEGPVTLLIDSKEGFIRRSSLRKTLPETGV